MPLSLPSPRISSLIHLLCLLFLSPLHAQTPTWNLKSPRTQPEAREQHTLTYDSARRQIVMLGAPYPPLSGPIWIWDGSNWSEPELAGLLPVQRSQHAAAFDEARGETIFFGGSIMGLLTNQTLVCNGSTLRQRNPAKSPPPRGLSAMAYDAERKQIVLFGGGAPLQNLGDTWVWDGLTWQLKTPINSPPARYGHTMTWDPVRKVVLLFGGRISGPQALASDIWAWNGSDWTQYAPVLSPPPRAMHSMAYVPSLDRTVIFGGLSTDGSTLLGDMWNWDGANWTQITSLPIPTPRRSSAMAYDASRGELVLFGGFYGDERLNDTWIFSNTPAATGFFTLSPPSLTVSATTLDTPPAIPPITVTAPYQAPFTVSTTTADGRSWLRASPPSSTTPSTIQVSIDPSTLIPGTYSGSVSISAPSLGVPPQSVPVSLTVESAGFTVNPPSSSFLTANGSQTTAFTSIDVGTSVATQATFSARSTAPWLTVSPSSGVSPARLSAVVNPSGLAAGTHAGTISIYDPSGKLLPAYHTVHLTVQLPPPPPPPLTLAVHPNSLTLSAWTAHGERTATIVVSPSIPLSPISASASTNDGGSWLSVSPASIVPAPTTQFTISLNPSSLSAGIYSGSIVFSSPGAPTATVTVPVSLTVYSEQRILPWLADGGGWFTTISLVNLESTPAPFVLRFFQSSGAPLPLPLEGFAQPLETFESTIPARGLLTLRSRGSHPVLFPGWAELGAAHNIQGLAVFSHRSPTENGLDTAVAIQSPSTQSALLIDNVIGSLTDFTLANPSFNTNDIAAEAFHSNGAPSDRSTINLFARNLIRPLLAQFVPTTSLNQSLVLFKSETAPFAGHGFRFHPFSPAGPYTSFPLLTPLPNPAGALVIPHFADGGEGGVWRTRVAIVNHSTAAVRARVSFFGPDGSPQPLPSLMGANPLSDGEVTILGRSPLFLTTTGQPGPVRQGWLNITTSDPAAQLSALAVFRRTEEGLPTYEAAVAAAAPGGHFVLPFDNTAGSATALALANTMESSAAAITITARDENGAIIISVPLDLPASGQSAFRLLDHLPLTAGRRGTIELESAAGISCMGLQFNPSGTFTSIPAIARPPGL